MLPPDPQAQARAETTQASLWGRGWACTLASALSYSGLCS